MIQQYAMHLDPEGSVTVSPALIKSGEFFHAKAVRRVDGRDQTEIYLVQPGEEGYYMAKHEAREPGQPMNIHTVRQCEPVTK